MERNRKVGIPQALIGGLFCLTVGLYAGAIPGYWKGEQAGKEQIVQDFLKERSYAEIHEVLDELSVEERQRNEERKSRVAYALGILQLHGHLEELSDELREDVESVSESSMKKD